ncbi:MAG: hypothetical protein LBD37_08905 [Treponema sp.]|jgi:alpha-tubulin suppressor-like RCC1 family protein|nr:hypothetical protein [Treponema sp.]
MTKMTKKSMLACFSLSVAALFFAASLVFTGCPTNAEDDPPPPPPPAAVDLANAVYGGLNPGGAWVTVAFKTGNKAVCAFSMDNTTNEFGYTYLDNKTGSVSNATGSSFSLGAFTMNDDESVLTFTNFGGHGGALNFKRLRKADLTVAAEPAGLAALPASLYNAVFGGSTPQDTNTGWLTLVFKGNYKVQGSFANNTTSEWSYSYDNGKGTIDTGGSWTPGAFTVANGALTFTNYGGHGAPKTFTRYHQKQDDPAASMGVVRIFALARSGGSFVIKADGTLWAAGTNTKGTLGIGVLDSRSQFTLIKDASHNPITNIKDMTMVFDTARLLKKDGTVWAAGPVEYGSFGTLPAPTENSGNIVRFTQLKESNNTTPITGVSAIGGPFYIKNGELWVSGVQTSGELGIGKDGMEEQAAPIRVEKTADNVTITGVEAVISSIQGSSFFVKNGEVWACGKNTNGELGLGDTTLRNKFTKVPGLSNVADIKIFGDSGGNYGVIALKKDGTIWGAGNRGYLGIEPGNDITSFTQLPTNGTIGGPAMTDVAAIASSGSAWTRILLLKKDGTVWFSGTPSNAGMTGMEIRKFAQVKDLYGDNLTNVSGIAASSTHSLYLLKDGNVLAVGLRNAGLGLGSDLGNVKYLEDITDFGPNFIKFAD